MALVASSSTGGTGGGQPPQQPWRKDHGPAYSKLSEAEKRNAKIRDLANWVDRNYNTVARISGTNITASFVDKLLEAFDDVGNHVFQLKNRPLQLWMNLFRNQRSDNTSEYHPAHAPALQPNFAFNPAGGNNYLPCILASVAAGGRNQTPRCARCAAGRMNYFSECVTLPGAFRGACTNCAWTNHYEQCSFVQPAPAPLSSVGATALSNLTLQQSTQLDIMRDALLDWDQPAASIVRNADQGTITIPWRFDPNWSQEEYESQVLRMLCYLVRHWADTALIRRDSRRRR